jgi:hypothetical protein
MSQAGHFCFSPQLENSEARNVTSFRTSRQKRRTKKQPKAAPAPEPIAKAIKKRGDDSLSQRLSR